MTSDKNLALLGRSRNPVIFVGMQPENSAVFHDQFLRRGIESFVWNEDQLIPSSMSARSEMRRFDFGKFRTLQNPNSEKRGVNKYSLRQQPDQGVISVRKFRVPSSKTSSSKLRSEVRELLQTGSSVQGIIQVALEKEKANRKISHAERMQKISQMLQEISAEVYQGKISETEQAAIHNLALFILELESAGGVFEIQRSSKTGKPVLISVGRGQVTLERLGDIIQRRKTVMLPSESSFVIRELGLKGDRDLQKLVQTVRGDPKKIGRALAMSVIQNDLLD